MEKLRLHDQSALTSNKPEPPKNTAQSKDNNNIVQEEPKKPTPPNNMQSWMPAILALFGSLIVVSFTAWLNTKAVTSQIDALRAEMKQYFAEFRLEVRADSSDVRHRVERLEEERRR